MQVETVVIREATENDLVSIVALFADDPLGGHGDTTEPEALPDYRAAFAHINASQNETLYVAELGGEVVGTFQTMVTTTLTGRGAAMIEFAVERARQDGMRVVQLTSNAVRKDAHRFYERLGFTASHIGFKLKLK